MHWKLRTKQKSLRSWAGKICQAVAQRLQLDASVACVRLPLPSRCAYSNFTSTEALAYSGRWSGLLSTPFMCIPVNNATNNPCLREAVSRSASDRSQRPYFRGRDFSRFPLSDYSVCQLEGLKARSFKAVILRSISSAARSSTAIRPAHLFLFGFTAVETG